MPERDGRRSWPARLAIGFVVFALVMAVASWLVLSSWTTTRTATASEARVAFDLALAGTPDGPPYLEITPGGEVRVHRELERAEPVELHVLHLLAFEPDRERLTQVDVPFWFVRMKLSQTVGLGTLVAGLLRDWDDLDLGIDEDDLERRGPGRILDHTRPSGPRVVLWTE